MYDDAMAAESLLEKAQRIRRGALTAPDRLYHCRMCHDDGYVVSFTVDQEGHRREVAMVCPDEDCGRRRAMRAA